MKNVTIFKDQRKRKIQLSIGLSMLIASIIIIENPKALITLIKLTRNDKKKSKLFFCSRVYLSIFTKEITSNKQGYNKNSKYSTMNFVSIIKLFEQIVGVTILTPTIQIFKSNTKLDPKPTCEFSYSTTC